MNKTIEELVAKAGVEYDIDPGTYGPEVSFECQEDLEKFATMIVQECIRVGSIAFLNDSSVVPVFPTTEIKNHFGITQ